MTSFRKNDEGKLRFDLLDPAFLEELVKVLTYGAGLYGANNWTNCPTPYERYYSALQRHLNAFAKGERADPDTGHSHLSHAAACLQFLAHFERAGVLDG